MVSIYSTPAIVTRGASRGFARNHPVPPCERGARRALQPWLISLVEPRPGRLGSGGGRGEEERRARGPAGGSHLVLSPLQSETHIVFGDGRTRCPLGDERTT